MNIKKFSLLSILLALPLFLATPCLGAKTAYLGLNSIENMRPNGEYIIEVFKDGGWHKAGSLAFDRVFRERKMDLSPFLPEGRTVRVRITQKGGGAAHIDSIFLASLGPEKISGIKNENPLRKLSKRDFDVVDGFKKTLVLTFPASAKDKTFALSARVENKVISKTPFQFPLENLFRTMDENSRFYRYRLGTKDSLEPFFKEWSKTGSGHPSNFTYGYVNNDEENLYVKIDFTPANTRDTGKDYAKVYVKTKQGLKEFKVSEAETRWGQPSFTYTDKVSYQHQVYDFRIPLKELEINDTKDGEFLLAFAAYGSAAPAGNYYPSLAYDQANARFLVVYFVSDGAKVTGSIYGQLVGADGSPSGSSFLIYQTFAYQERPSVAYDSTNQRFLVVWVDNPSGSDYYIYGQLVNADGSLNGSDFQISTVSNAEHEPVVVYDSANQRFLVVWMGWRSTTSDDIFGQLVNADGSLNGSNFAISTVSDSQYAASIAYDSTNQRFLVCWEDYRSGTDYDIYGQLVTTGGSLSGSELSISTASDSQYSPSVAYDDVNQRFLVAWQDYRSGSDYDIYGQLVTTGGSLSGSELSISTASDSQYVPSVAYDSTNQRFLVAWQDNRSGTDYDIYGQYVASLVGSNFAISTAGGGFGPEVSVAYNPDCTNFLAAFDTDANDIGFAVVSRYKCGPICTDSGAGTSEPETLPQISAGTAQADFTMMSFLHRPDDPSAASVFGVTYDTKNYKIGTYDPATGGYIEYGTLNIEPGRAYWVLARNGLSITSNGVPVSLVHDIEVKLGYNSSTGNGWNMIAPPNGANYLWENVEVVEYDSDCNIVFGPTAISALSDPNDYIDKRLWRWENGSYYSDTSLMEKYRGYWVKVKKPNVYLRFPPSAQASLSNPSTMFAGLLNKGKRRIKRWFFAPRTATAGSGDSPPLPMGGLSSAPEGARGGCFISTAAY